LGTPFNSYVAPALILGVAVGGSALAATILVAVRHPLAVAAAFGAGAIQVGWIVGELLLVGTADSFMFALQTLYLVAGTALAVLALHALRSTEARPK
jgi:hypothetical protein